MSQPMPFPARRCKLCRDGIPLVGAFHEYPSDSTRAECADRPDAEVDMVGSPPHYNTGRIQVLDFIEDQKFGFLDGQIIKYIARYRWKNAPLEDLKRCQFYLARLIKNVEEEK